MKKVSWMLLALMAFAIAGCAQKSESEKAMDQMKKEIDNL